LAHIVNINNLKVVKTKYRESLLGQEVAPSIVLNMNFFLKLYKRLSRVF